MFLLCIYNQEPQIQTEDEVVEISSTEAVDDSIPFTNILGTTGISTVKSVYGLSGKGINIGVIDYFTNKKYDDYLDVSKITLLSDGNNLLNEYAVHGNKITATILGYKDVKTGTKVEGVAPSSKVFWYECDAGFSPVKNAIEQFLYNNCSIVNLSCGWPEVENGEVIYNHYSSLAKYFDYVIYHHCLHIVSCSSNTSCTTIASGNMAYNAIMVGYCDMDGNSIPKANDYSSLSQSPYKPDLVSPFSKVKMFYNQETNEYVVASGTSYASPTVAGTVALFCEMSSTLKVFPHLMKSLIMSGTYITSEMVQMGASYSAENDNTIALNHEYGAGKLNAVNSYDIISNHNFSFGSLHPDTPKTAITTNKLYPKTDYDLRVSLCYSKRTTFSSSNNSTYSYDLDDLYLKVTTPSGKVYKSAYKYDNKQMVTFPTTESGYYNIEVGRSSNQNSGASVLIGVSYALVRRQTK